MTIKETTTEYLAKFKATIASGLIWVKQNKLKSFYYIILAAVLFQIIMVTSIYLGVWGKIPSTKALKQITNPETTTIYSGNNKVIGYFYTENRSNIDSSQINENIKNALIATEDVRFLEHSGIDYRSLGRVLFKTILMSKKSSGGGSTITQQLAKNVFGRKKRFFLLAPINKVREMIIAKRLEKVYSKDEILLLYLNTVSFGERLFGLEKASLRFFNKKPEKLDLDEAATLIGILKATSYYNPRNNPQNSLRRRNVVLSQMVKYGYLEEAEFDKIKDVPTKLNYTLPKVESTFAAFYKDYLRKEFETWAEDNPKDDGETWNLDEDGLTIYTTIHSSVQTSAEKAVDGHMKRLQESFATNWDAVGGKEKYIEKLIKNQSLAKQMDIDGIPFDSIQVIYNKKSEKKLWNGFEIVTGDFSLIDSIIFELTTLQTGLMVMHTQTGKIMGYVGGKDYGYSQYDQLSIPKQAGSLFKPITYLAGLESGLDPCDFFDNELRSYSDYEGWSPKNADGVYGGSYSLYGALANSVNTVSVQVIFKAGISRVVKLAERMGITAPLKAVPSLVLGTSEVKPIEMITAFAAIANKGKVVKPYSIQKILDHEGNVIYEAKVEYAETYIANPENIDKLQRMMTYTNTIGTGSRIQGYNIPYNLIGKTGTTQNNADGWYIASSPELVCGAWVGTMNPSINFKYTSLGSGSNTALPMVGRVFGDLSMWGTSMLTNFTFDTPDFDCNTYSELTAVEAFGKGRFDSTTMQLDTLIEAIDSVEIEEQ